MLMTLVIADCLPRRTRWPRGVLLGLGIALKLTPAVFLLYFALRRDGRATLTALGSFVAATLAGFVLAWADSWEYWTNTVRNTDRIGAATLNTNQNIAGALARSGLGERERFVLWVFGCLLVLAVTVWATRRVLRAGEPALAVICVALFGLVVSPVSWSHHWVWILPAILVTAVLAWRRRSAAVAAVSCAGRPCRCGRRSTSCPSTTKRLLRGGVNYSARPTCGGRWRQLSRPESPSPPLAPQRSTRRPQPAGPLRRWLAE
ncbi:alpha-D-mannose-alpha(1,2)-mannosyltransferase [Mycobacterium xenopi 3993]|nr:alpha-D-mannose-alpha(1,2)-mannosyltransferase [Mycobacterium xenopi 3993]